MEEDSEQTEEQLNNSRARKGILLEEINTETQTQT